jgi:signal peptidase I
MSRHTAARLGTTFALAAVTSFAMAVAVSYVAARAQGYRLLSVLSGSMTPHLRVGDLIVDEPARARDLRAGQVVTFRDPDGGTRLITHRVRSAVENDGRIEVVTKGDRNNAVEKWQLPADGQVGRVVARVPFAGRLVAGLSGRAGRLGLLIVILCWAAYEVRDRRGAESRPDPTVPDEPSAEADQVAADATDDVPDDVPDDVADAPTEPVRVHRRASAAGVIVVCRQPIRLGRAYAGRTLSLLVDDHTVTVEVDGDLLVVRRTTTLPVRNVNASRPRRVMVTS